jgi:hypothetical protein
MMAALFFGALSLGGTVMASALLAAPASFVAGPNVALAAALQHHDQVPGFYRLKVGDLEVTALFDGTGVFDIGYVSHGLYQTFYEDTVSNIRKWLDTH